MIDNVVDRNICCGKYGKDTITNGISDFLGISVCCAKENRYGFIGLLGLCTPLFVFFKYITLVLVY